MHKIMHAHLNVHNPSFSRGTLICRPHWPWTKPADYVATLAESSPQVVAPSPGMA